MSEIREALRRFLADHHRVLVLTGAGCSVEADCARVLPAALG